MYEPLLSTLVNLWGGVTVIYGALLVWRYLIGIQKDVVILDSSESGIAAEQAVNAEKLEHIAEWARAFGYASLVLMAAIAVLYLYGAWGALNAGGQFKRLSFAGLQYRVAWAH